MSCRHLILVLGDQLDRRASVLENADRENDLVLMIEAREESQRVWSHKARTALFLAAMRHHAEWLRAQGFTVDYLDIHQPESAGFECALKDRIEHHKPDKLRMVEAGEHAVEALIKAVCGRHDVALEIVEDGHFLCSREAFAKWREGRKTLTMEHFYRWMRKRHDILIEGGKPRGGTWNFDKENRRHFGRQGPGMPPAPRSHTPDEITRRVLVDVEKIFPDNPGRLDSFSWPVTREQALETLEDFIRYRLMDFGPFQDAMWTDEPWLYHATIAAAMNLKLLDPEEVISAAVDALERGDAPLASVEGFVRQILGWREYVHGIYWTEGPGYLGRNALKAELALPNFYWDGDTEMHCLRQAITQTLTHGYAHHIQRLMVTGLFALLLGVRPRELHRWYLAVYVDAVEWVEAPNTLGMSQHADGGLLGSKPYVASGRYIQRMSNYCDHCRYKPDQSTGDDACPFTTLYWDFLMRHEDRFRDHPRAGMQWRMLERFDDEARSAVSRLAQGLRERFSAG